MFNLSELLNADWARLRTLAGLAPCKRRLVHSFSPRFAAVSLIRTSQYLHFAGKPRLAKVPALVNFILFGIEVSPRMSIGPGLVLLHTQGSVLGAYSIGENVTIYHQVTLGARDLNFDYTSSLRPIVKSDVVIGAGAKVLGGITLEKDCSVGANAVVLQDVPAGHLAVGIPARSTPRISRVSIRENE